MKKAGAKGPEPKPEGDKVSEKVKRVYRVALDTTKRLDEILKQKKAYRDVFLPDAVMLRSRLQDICERIMFYDPLECGRKAEELLWRKVFYDVIQLMKHNRKQMRPSSSLESAFRTHLSAAMGYYNHLLFKLQHEFQLNLGSLLDFFCVPEPRSHKRAGHGKKPVDPKVKEWALKASHRCLVSLGDLARYQLDYDECRSPSVAQRYYWQAFTLCPEIGMPHNQLGTLAGTRQYNIDAAYHYLRCMTSPVSFEGAHDNLMRLFEKNKKKYQEISIISPRDLHPDQQRSKDVKRFFIRFMHLLEVFMVHWQSRDQSELQECCQTTLLDFNQCMFYQHSHEHENQARTDDKLHYMDGEVVFKIAVICMMVIFLMQKQGDKLVTAAIAFSLALFSHMLNHTVIRLQAALSELENPRKPLYVDEEISSETPNSPKTAVMNGECDALPDLNKSPVSSHSQDLYDNRSQEDEKIEKRRQKLKRMLKRRRRRRCSAGSSDSEKHTSSGAESDLSEGEEHAVMSASDSEDEAMKYLNSSDSSESDSDDNLMVSQELRPGFSLGQPDQVEGQITQNLNNLNSQSTENSLDEYFQNFSADSLSDSSNFLKLGIPFVTQKDTDETDAYNDVVHGKRDVRVPPGFEKASEAQHVKEITEKLNNYVIETDTDTSNFPTDTDNSSIPTESEIETDAESVIDRAELEARRLERLIEVIRGEGLLSTVKVFCDWMRCHPQIIMTTAQSSQTLWTRLSVLLNFLPQESDLTNEEICQNRDIKSLIVSYCSQTPDISSSPPLSEDQHMHKFPAIHEVHKSIIYTTEGRLELDREHEALLRICWLRKFGYFLPTVQGLNFSFDVEKGVYYGPHDMNSSQDENGMPEKIIDDEARRNQLMRDMAQLRLQAEVSQLEGSLQANERPNLPLYLVPDATALCGSLGAIRPLVTSARFIIIIPLAVIDHLDQLKKETSGAREAIRWLEAEFKKGNRYIRAQKHHEKSSNAPQRNLKKKDIEAWRFFQMIDCAKYLSQQRLGATGMVAILTNQTGKATVVSARVQQAVSASQQEGIAVHNAQEFHSQWKEIVTNKG